MLEAIIIFLWLCGLYDFMRRAVERRMGMTEMPSKDYYILSFIIALIWPAMTIITFSKDMTGTN